MDIPIQTDPEVLEHLYTHFAYLKGYPLGLKGSFLDEASSLGVLQAGDFLGFLLAYEEGRVGPTDFPFLTAEENANLTRYRHLRPVEPWPQPTIGVLWDDLTGQGVTLDTERMDVTLKPVGNVQLWHGGETGVLWEAFFERSVRERREHERLLHLLWGACEAYLHKEGVRSVHTYMRDPTFGDAWYGAFLHARGYRRDPARAHLPRGRVGVVKKLDP